MNTNSNILNITHAKSITVQTHTINCQKRSFIILLSNSISCHSLPIVMICSFLHHWSHTISLMYFSVAGERWKEDRRHTRSRENRGKKKNKIHLIKYFL